MIRLYLLLVFPLSVCGIALQGGIEKGEQRKIYKVLILGNSITKHNKAPQIGWDGNWGMAASAPNKDYVHLLKKEFEKKYDSISMLPINVAKSFEHNYAVFDSLSFKDAQKYNPDLVIVRLGENIDKQYFREHPLDKSLVRMVKYVMAENKDAKVCITNLFWPDTEIDEELKTIAAANNWYFVSLTDLSLNVDNKATGQYKDSGVANHPSDLGMQKIKNKIWDIIKSI